MDKLLSRDEALKRTQTLCSKQEKCCSEIRQKLIDWHINYDDIDDIIQQLLNDGFIDESRYAVAFANDKFRFNYWGKLKIKFSLLSKQINESFVDNALNQINMKEYKAMVENEIKKKYKSTPDNSSYQQKNKVLRFTQSRGYDQELSYEIFDRLRTQ